MLFPAGKRPAEARWVSRLPRSNGETVLDSGAVSLRIQYRGIPTKDISSELELLRSRKGHSVVELIYDAAKQDTPIDVIKKQLHVA